MQISLTYSALVTSYVTVSHVEAYLNLNEGSSVSRRLVVSKWKLFSRTRAPSPTFIVYVQTQLCY